MELINHTRFPHLFFRTPLDENRFASAVLIRVTYDTSSGQTLPAEKQSWPLSNKNWDSDYGTLVSDEVFKKGGVDIMAFGNAIAPGGRPLTEMEVSVKFKNEINYRLKVLGNRTWTEGMRSPVISKTEPFVEMPILLENSYGGQSEWDGLKIPHGSNPKGKGFYWEKEDAIGQPLPNLENPDQLIVNWNDRPDPVGLGCFGLNEVRVRDNVEHDGKGKITKINPRMFNHAFPGLIADKVLPGDRIQISGMTPSGKYEFQVPEHHFSTKISIGEDVLEQAMYIDQVGIIPAAEQAFITYRCPFRYVFTALQKRFCEVFEQPQN